MAPLRKPALLSLLVLLSAPGWALESVSDDALSGVSAQAGIDLSLINPNNTAAITTTNFQSIAGNTGATSTLEMQGLTFDGISTNGVSAGAGTISSQGAYRMKTSLDVGSTGTTPTLGIGVFWGKNFNSTFAADNINTATNAMRLEVTSMDLLNGSGTQSAANGYGSLAFDSSGSLRISNLSGLFSKTGELASSDPRILRLTIGSPQFGVAYSSAVASYGQLYYRQAQTAAGYGSTSSETNSELVFDHMYLDTGFTPGVGGVLSTCISSSGTSTARCGGNTLYSSAPTAYPTTAASSYSGWFNGFSSNNNGGIYLGTSHLDFNFSYDVSYRSCSAGSPCTGIFTTANNVSPIGHLSWSGGFDYAELMLGTGGIWNNVTSYNPDDPGDQLTTDCTPACTGATRAHGLNIAFHGNYDSNFTWTVGDAPGNTVANGPGGRDIAFGSWTTLPGAAWSLSAPNITLDTMNAGAGPGGLCWGAQAYGTTGTCTASTTKWANGSQSGATPGTFLNLPPTNTNLGLVVRDLSLQAYSSTVQTLDDKNNNGSFGDAGETNNYSWGLIYTLGQFDQNMYIYPGNSDVTTTADGITLDWLLMSQSFGTYPVFKALGSASTTNALLGNTNFMIADTGYLADGTAACGGLSTGTCAFGIGLVQANLLVGAKRMNISLQSAGMELKSSDVRFEMQGLVAGGPVPNLQYQYLQKLYYADVNMEATQFDMVLKPATSNGYPYLGFTNRVTLGDTTLAGSTIGVPESSPGANGCAGLNPTSTVDCNYVSLGEPSSPSTDFRIADITGDINITNGVFGLFSAADTTNSIDGKPRLVLAETMQIGTTIGSGSQAPLTGIVKFGGTEFGKIIIPSGQAYGYVALKPQ
jgi:hypothetical protein